VGVYFLIVLTPFIRKTPRRRRGDRVDLRRQSVAAICCCCARHHRQRFVQILDRRRLARFRLDAPDDAAADVLAARERVLKRLGMTLVMPLRAGTRILIRRVGASFTRRSTVALRDRHRFIYAGSFCNLHALAPRWEQARRTLPFAALGIVVL